MSDGSLLQCILNIHPSGVLIALFGGDMAGVMRNCCCLGVFCVHHTTMPCHFMQSLVYKVHVCFSYNLPPALLAEWPGSLCATAVTQGWNGYYNKSQHRTLTTEKKTFWSLLLGLEPVTVWSWFRCSNQWAVLAPCSRSNCLFLRL